MATELVDDLAYVLASHDLSQDPEVERVLSRYRAECKDVRRAMEQIVDWIVSDPTPCRYDHHDACQTHFLHGRPCPFGVIRMARNP